MAEPKPARAQATIDLLIEMINGKPAVDPALQMANTDTVQWTNDCGPGSTASVYFYGASLSIFNDVLNISVGSSQPTPAASPQQSNVIANYGVRVVTGGTPSDAGPFCIDVGTGGALVVQVHYDGTNWVGNPSGGLIPATQRMVTFQNNDTDPTHICKVTFNQNSGGQNTFNPMTLTVNPNGGTASATALVAGPASYSMQTSPSAAGRVETAGMGTIKVGSSSRR